MTRKIGGEHTEAAMALEEGEEMAAMAKLQCMSKRQHSKRLQYVLTGISNFNATKALATWRPNCTQRNASSKSSPTLQAFYTEVKRNYKIKNPDSIHAPSITRSEYSTD